MLELIWLLAIGGLSVGGLLMFLSALWNFLFGADDQPAKAEESESQNSKKSKSPDAVGDSNKKSDHFGTDASDGDVSWGHVVPLSATEGPDTVREIPQINVLRLSGQKFGDGVRIAIKIVYIDEMHEKK